jgi:hypothetical protein
MKRWLAVSVLSALVALTILAGVHAQGVTQPFTYQGFLRQGGAPLNNPSQAMRFRIYDALTGGTALWDSGALTVNVSNGLFTVQLNPPVSVWTGADRFLEIQVGTTTLTPRVRLGATPYANTATLLNMFQSGTMNPDRMVITHSPAFSNWGLMYRDTDDSFHFLAGGTTVLRVGLGGPTALQIPAGAAAGRVLTSDASGNASWQALPPSATVWAVSGTNIYNTNRGNVGIGTTSPTSLLQVRYASGQGGISSTGPSGETWFPWTDGNAYISAANIIFRNSANVERMRITGAGNVGIGTPSPAAKLHVNGSMLLDGNPMVYMFSSGSSNPDRMVIAHSPTYNNWGLMYRDADDSVHFVGAGWTHVRIGIGDGLVGINTTAPSGRLHIVHNSTLASPTLRLHEAEAEFARLEFTNTNTARKWHIAGYIGSAVADDRLNFWNSAAGDIMSIRGDGTVAVKVLEITGADLAEKFPTTETLEPGTVVEIDPDNPGRLRKARGAYNKRVAGVVAGANGLSKGIILGNLEGSEDHTPIAMSGRVWVHADATHEAIEPGDLLTTSDLPGHAMKASDPSRAHGTVIGKAMTRLEKGKTGMVLVLVNLQ